MAKQPAQKHKDKQDYCVDVDRATYVVLIAHLHDPHVLGTPPEGAKARIMVTWHLQRIFAELGIETINLTMLERDAWDAGQLKVTEA